MMAVKRQRMAERSIRREGCMDSVMQKRQGRRVAYSTIPPIELILLNIILL
jgi:hypothetical protein